MFKGLSTSQAPAITVPFRFFLTAPVFALLISILLLIYPIDEILNRYSAVAVAITHLFTLGILSMVMFGALQQMLPVLAGVVIKKAKLFAAVVHLSLSFGALALSGGFLISSTLLLSIGAILLLISFGVFLITILKLLFGVKFLTPTVDAMKIFSLVSLITVMFGLFLVLSHIIGNIVDIHYNIVDIHILFGIFGFGIILVMGVSFQVIPMFYVTKELPNNIKNKFPRVIAGMLILSILFTVLKLNIAPIKELLSILSIVFAYYALVSLNNRRRPVFDITLWYWKLSMISLIVSLCLYMFGIDIYIVVIILALGFFYSLLQGMVYKIIPFLSWFHLSSKGHFDIPTLREFIYEYDIKVQFYIYAVSILFFLLAVVVNHIFLYIGTVLFMMSNILLIVNMIKAMKKYDKLSKLDPMAAYK